jgi:RhoGAP domain
LLCFTEEHFTTDFQLLRSKIRRLPHIHRNTLKAVALHLNRVAAHREKNKMDAKNLAIVFGIFGNEDELPKGGDLLSVQAVNVIFISTD